MARILVIDDDAEMRAMLEQTLASVGHEVVLAANGKQGMRQYRAKPPSLVITDLFMPEKEGLETIIELRRDFPNVEIIAMSGKPTGNTLLSIAMHLGAARTIEKPFHPRDLLSAVEEVLGSKA
jgi:DNA-binding NtrC family response regulator